MKYNLKISRENAKNKSENQSPKDTTMHGPQEKMIMERMKTFKTLGKN